MSETKPAGEESRQLPANPKQIHGDRKVPLHLVPPALVIGAARALGEGVKKGYGPFNWRHSKVQANTYIGAIMRHLQSYLDGEEVDPESIVGKHHLDGAAASLAILMDAKDGGFLIDDRPPRGPAPGLLRDPGFTPAPKTIPVDDQLSLLISDVRALADHGEIGTASRELVDHVEALAKRAALLQDKL